MTYLINYFNMKNEKSWEKYKPVSVTSERHCFQTSTAAEVGDEDKERLRWVGLSWDKTEERGGSAGDHYEIDSNFLSRPTESYQSREGTTWAGSVKDKNDRS